MADCVSASVSQSLSSFFRSDRAERVNGSGKSGS